MAQVPDTIILRRDRDLGPRRNDIWVRRGLFALVCVVPLLALLNVFGQRPDTSTGTAAAARLSVSAPSRVRGGLLYQARFTITATKTDQTKGSFVKLINTIEPSPASETSRNGKLAFDLGPISAGTSYLFAVDFQVNPTTVGRQDQSLTLYDGSTALVTIHRTLTIFP